MERRVWQDRGLKAAASMRNAEAQDAAAFKLRSGFPAKIR
jgi:hypothetical protein